jgi:hypothetical protein
MERGKGKGKGKNKDRRGRASTTAKEEVNSQFYCFIDSVHLAVSAKKLCSPPSLNVRQNKFKQCVFTGECAFAFCVFTNLPMKSLHTGNIVIVLTNHVCALSNTEKIMKMLKKEKLEKT